MSSERGFSVVPVETSGVTTSQIHTTIRVSQVVNEIVKLKSITCIGDHCTYTRQLVNRTSHQSNTRHKEPEVEPTKSTPNEGHPGQTTNGPRQRTPTTRARSEQPIQSKPTTRQRPTRHQRQAPKQRIPKPRRQKVPSMRATTKQGRPTPQPSQPSSSYQARTQYQRSNPTPQ